MPCEKSYLNLKGEFGEKEGIAAMRNTETSSEYGCLCG